jgi:hypothetical protein
MCKGSHASGCVRGCTQVPRHLTKARAWIAHQAISGRIALLSHVARLLQRDESSLRESVRRHFPA